MRAGIAAAIALLVIGILLIGFNYYTIKSSGEYYPKFFALGCGLFVMSLFMFVFPGAKMTFAEIRKLPSKGRGGPLWVNAPGLHKAMWIVGVVIGVAVAIYVIVDLKNGGPITEFLMR